ncbi:MAG: gamma-glutamyl-gamma-aminobutyrate hydrolase family protein, partial [Bacteroidota bacterium]
MRNVISIFYLWLLPVSGILIQGCSGNAPVQIGISKASENYIRWLKRADTTVRTVDLYALPIDSAMNILKKCSALLLTGGEDVYPGWYGKENDTSRCTEMNRHRDSLDMALISVALERKMPVIA